MLPVRSADRCFLLAEWRKGVSAHGGYEFESRQHNSRKLCLSEGVKTVTNERPCSDRESASSAGGAKSEKDFTFYAKVKMIFHYSSHLDTLDNFSDIS